MPKMWSVAVSGAVLLLGARGSDAPLATAMEIREVADSNLRDVAVAVYNPAVSVIYYNPIILSRLGPDLSAFFMAHERAHIALRHSRSAALGLDPAGREQVLQEKELDADCLAARTLGNSGRTASLAAVRFFSRMGANRFDSEHPLGSDRAARIVTCMPQVD